MTLVVTSIVDGDSRIVASSAAGSCEIAANVVAASANSLAATGATGATVRMKPSVDRKKRVSSVLGAARYCATGLR